MILSNKLIFGRKYTSYFLDDYGDKALVYSLRKLTSEDLPCIKVRRSSDNQTMDIFYVNEIVDVFNLLNFVGLGDGFVHTWYDFSGLNRHAVQLDTTRQPRIVISGVLQQENGKPTISFTDQNWMPITNIDFVSPGFGTRQACLSNYALSKYEIIRFKTGAYQGTTGFSSKLQSNFNASFQALYMSVRGETTKFGFLANQDIRGGTVYAPTETSGTTFKLFNCHLDDTYDLASPLSKAYINTSQKTLLPSDNGYGIPVVNIINRTYNGIGSNVNISEIILFDAFKIENNDIISNNILSYYNVL